MTRLATTPPAAPANLLNVAETAAKLGVSTRTVWRLRDRAAIPAPVRVGSLVRWSDAALDEWIAGGCRPVARSSR